MPQPKLFSIIDKAVYEYSMIESGDRILVGASGGKDSTALVEYFANRKKQSRCDFEFSALNISTPVSPPVSSGLLRLFESWNVGLETLEVDVIGRLKEGEKMSCWWCSTQRRTELNNYAIKYGYNKIALGHHLDDILETLLMNALDKSELSTMIPKLKYKKYPVTIIRPLCFVDVNTIIEHAEKNGYISSTCTCSYQDNSGRRLARRRLESLTGGNVTEKRHLFEALRNIKIEYLP